MCKVIKILESVSWRENTISILTTPFKTEEQKGVKKLCKYSMKEIDSFRIKNIFINQEYSDTRVEQMTETD